MHWIEQEINKNKNKIILHFLVHWVIPIEKIN